MALVQGRQVGRQRLQAQPEAPEGPAEDGPRPGFAGVADQGRLTRPVGDPAPRPAAVAVGEGQAGQGRKAQPRVRRVEQEVPGQRVPAPGAFRGGRILAAEQVARVAGLERDDPQDVAQASSPRISRTRSTSLRGEKGFVMYSLAPHSRLVRRSTSWPFAVIMMM